MNPARSTGPMEVRHGESLHPGPEPTEQPGLLRHRDLLSPRAYLLPVHRVPALDILTPRRHSRTEPL